MPASLVEAADDRRSKSEGPAKADVPIVKKAPEAGQKRQSLRQGHPQAWQGESGGAVPLTAMDPTVPRSSSVAKAETTSSNPEKRIEPMNELDFEQHGPVYFASTAPNIVCGAGEEFLEQDDQGADVAMHRPGHREEIRHPLPRWLRKFFCTADEPGLEEGGDTSHLYHRRRKPDLPKDFDPYSGASRQDETG